MRRTLVMLNFMRSVGVSFSTPQIKKIIWTPSSSSHLSPVRQICLTGCSHATKTELNEVSGASTPDVQDAAFIRHPGKDRSKVIPVETSIKYMESDAYKQTYGDVPVWVPYRRNFKGQFAPRETRKTCIRDKKLTTSNACPLCRDEYLVVDYRNTKLLKQFISPFTGATLHWDKTGICRWKELDLLIAIERARDHGTITFDVPMREYNYDEYYK